MVLRLRSAARDDLAAAARWYETQEPGPDSPFPYGVIYLPVPDQSYIVVLAVLYCGRDPKLWQQRSRA